MFSLWILFTDDLQPHMLARQLLSRALQYPEFSTPMEVIIGLARSDYEKLLHDISPQHSAYSVLRRSPELDRWADERPFSMCVVIECNRLEALELYQAAKQHCPHILREIEYGLNSAPGR